MGSVSHTDPFDAHYYFMHGYAACGIGQAYYLSFKNHIALRDTRVEDHALPGSNMEAKAREWHLGLDKKYSSRTGTEKTKYDTQTSHIIFRLCGGVS